MSEIIDARQMAMQVLARWREANAFPDRIIPDSPDRGFVMDLVYGAVRQWRTLDWLLRQQVKRLPRGDTYAALLLGAQQIFFQPGIPPYAAVDATVAALKKRAPRATALVNAVLRNLLRNRETLVAALQNQPPAVRLSHPDILLQRWEKQYDNAQIAALCEWNNQPAETIVLMLPHCRYDAPQWLALLQAQGLATGARIHAAAPTRAVVLPHGAPRLETLPGYAEGWFVIQDPATVAALELLDVRPGQRILDACAAPGGKTMQIAALLCRQNATHPPPPGALTALDAHRERLAFLRENLQRVGMDWVTVNHADATTYRPAIRYDRILLDAPCSNTGVLRRRPDARWRFTAHRLQELVACQRALLANTIDLLAPGGILVYSTCSLEPEENQLQIERLLAMSAPSLRLLATRAPHPLRDGTDGAFAAALQKA